MTKANQENGYVTPIAHSTVEVYDDRPELGNPMKLVASFRAVPADWTGAEILRRYGIAEHFHVVRGEDRLPEIIQHGRR